jgi:hypothetical protein
VPHRLRDGGLRALHVAVHAPPWRPVRPPARRSDRSQPCRSRFASGWTL